MTDPTAIPELTPEEQANQRELYMQLLQDKEAAARWSAAQAIIDDQQAKALALQTATVANAKALQDEKDRASDLAQQAKDADSRKAIAQSEQETVKAAKDAVAAWIPDLSTLKAGKTELSTKPVMYGPRLASRALAAAAQALGADLATVLSDASKAGSIRILLTDDAKLVNSDSAYLDLAQHADTLLEGGTAALKEATDDPDFDPSTVAEHEKKRIQGTFDANKVYIDAGSLGYKRSLDTLIGGGLIGGGVQAAIQAAPQIASLFAVNRDISYEATTPDVISAHAAVARELIKHPGVSVTQDDFRLTPEDGIFGTMHSLNALALKLDTASRAAKAFTDTNKPSDPPAGDGDAKAAHDALLAKLQLAAERETDLGERAKDIAAFITSATTVATGETRSPLTTAAMREQLYGLINRFDFVLLVPSPTVEAHQVLSDRIIGWDRLTVAGSVSLSYLLLDTVSGNLAAAGVVEGSAGMHGRVGDELTLEETVAPLPMRTSWWVIARAVVLTAVGITVLLVHTPSAGLVEALIAAVAVEGLIGSLQASLSRVRKGWTWLLIQGLVPLVLAILVAAIPAFLPLAIPLYGLLCGALALRSRYGLSGRTAGDLGALAGAISIAFGVATAVIFLFVVHPAPDVLPRLIGLYAALAGIILFVASIQEPLPPKQESARKASGRSKHALSAPTPEPTPAAAPPATS
jgi:hypothetical protein